MQRDWITVIVNYQEEEWRTVYIDFSLLPIGLVKGYGNNYGRYYGHT